MNTTRVTFDLSHQGKPIVTIDGGPFIDATRTPAELRDMAAMLIRLANKAEARPTKGRNAHLPTTMVVDATGQEVR